MIQMIEVKHLGAAKKWQDEPAQYMRHITANQRHKVDVKEVGAVAIVTCLECAISWEIEIGG